MSEEMEEVLLSEPAPRGVGETLKTAREEKALSVQEAAARLRLMARQIEAMEAEDFASLGQPVFARGFVRNYAKLLGLDEAALLAKMSPAESVTMPQAENLPFAPKPGFWTSPWVMSSIGAILLVLAVPVALYLWLNSGETLGIADPIAVKPQADLVAPAQPVMPEQPLAPAPEAPLSGQDETSRIVPADTLPSAENAAQAVTVLPLQSSVNVTPDLVTQTQQPTGLANEAAMQTIQFRLSEPAWLQVRDGRGKMVHSALNLAGASVLVKGTPPFSLVVGNAAKVQVTYRNKPVDITPYIDVTVARFTLD